MAYPQLTDKPGALETAAAIRAGTLSVAEAVDAAITRVEKYDSSIDALAVPDFERAYDTATAMDKHGPRADQPLFGVPMTIKESFDIAGLPTTWGHPRYKDQIAPRDSLLVRQLKVAGAVIIGKTNVPEFGFGSNTYNSVFGPTFNAYAHGLTAGGSSGGAAVARKC